MQNTKSKGKKIELLESDFSDFGLSHELCNRLNWYVYFGLDWLDEKEEEIFLREINESPNAVLTLADKRVIERFPVSSLDEAIKIESNLIVNDKIITYPSKAVIFISSDRDVYYVCSSKATIQRIQKNMANMELASVTQRFASDSRLVSSEAAKSFCYWRQRMLPEEQESA